MGAESNHGCEAADHRHRRSVRCGQGNDRARARRAPDSIGTSTPAPCTARSPGRRCDEGLDLQDEAAVAALSERARFDLEAGRVGHRRHDVSQAIRTPEIDAAATTVARHPAVRRVLVARQRDMGRAGGVVMEGRDIGTVVFPDADVKIYLDASPEERARRRANDPAHRSSTRRGAGGGRDRTGRARSQRLDPRGIAAGHGARRDPHRDDRRRRSSRWSSASWRLSRERVKAENGPGSNPLSTRSRNTLAVLRRNRRSNDPHSRARAPAAAVARARRACALFDPDARRRRRAPTSSGRSGADRG